MTSPGEEELAYLRQANASLRQSLEQLSNLQQLTLHIAAARSTEQLFRAMVAMLPSILPVIGTEALFRRPDSPTLFQLRHVYEPGAELASIPEQALEWARQRQAQCVLPLSQGAVIHCPLLFGQQDFGHLLVYISDADAHYNEATSIALDILAGQMSVTTSHLWNEARLEDENLTLKSRHQLLEDIVRAYPQSLLALDASGRLLYSNISAATIFGRNLSTLNGMHYQIVFPSEIADTISELFRPIQKGLPSPQKRLRFNNFLGEPRGLELSATPLPLPDKRSAGMLLLGEVVE